MWWVVDDVCVMWDVRCVYYVRGNLYMLCVCVVGVIWVSCIWCITCAYGDVRMMCGVYVVCVGCYVVWCGMYFV